MQISWDASEELFLMYFLNKRLFSWCMQGNLVRSYFNPSKGLNQQTSAFKNDENNTDARVCVCVSDRRCDHQHACDI